MTKWLEKEVTVFGIGKSGIAIAQKLLPLGAHIFITDSSPKEKIKSELIKDLESLGAQIETGGHTSKCIEKANLVVLSPGVNPDIPILHEARQKGIPIISEVELAARFFTKPIIAVTGTNGKTTTTTLIGEFLKAAGKKTAVAGNIGTPLVSVDDSQLDFIVAEISSYQLETVVSFRPWISIFLNLTEDHITRHKTMENYGDIKSRVFTNQKKTDYLIYNADDPLVSNLVKKSEARLIPISQAHAQEIIPLPLNEIKIKGAHNIENAMAAVSAAKLAGVPNAVIAQVLKTFAGVEHRIEYVVEKNGVRFYNDSKATNTDSTIIALKALGSDKKNIVLLLGGRDKMGDLSGMCELIKKTAKAVVLIGEAADRFEKALKKSGFNNIIRASDFKTAVTSAYRSAQANDIVLLSPACASFDMFASFEDRGEQFKALVKQL